ncbi:AAA family ATPase [Enterococcus faecalis]|uniref:AAA family ATPase n=1 Tax=Enterococcus faecalis TaxID=1351 RepID=UPI002DBBA477|nr:AAA family ATPase [Enterococcus faecalis]MEB6452222.1 AAA family ATPase [Enterococcus faecalis]MEB6568150.1 AAA family ATPase [Enterococcus faecalis]MEB6582295.1 AAA family ATPase [Enterococcus faecalis]MEB8077052.1 AAA family ATPase [Enterococcus faecalis]
MLDKLQSYTAKSFSNYNGPAEGFCQKNIIFGYNGCGKSSLAKGVIAQHQNSETSRLFNRRYVQNNLLFENDDSKIQGVKATFGEKQVTNVIKINELQSQLIKEDEYREKEVSTRTAIRNLIDKKHDQKKGSLSIKKKGKNDSLERVLSLYESDVKEAKKIQPDEEVLISYQGDNTLEQELTKLDRITVPDIRFSKEGTISAAISYLDRTFEDLLIPSSSIVRWLNEGLVIHEEKDQCQFCGGVININEIKQKVDQFNSSEKQKAILAFSETTDVFTEWIKRIDFFNNSSEILSLVFSEEQIDALTIELTQVMDKIKLIIESFEKKIRNIDEIIHVDQEELNKLFDTVREKYDEAKKSIIDKKQVVRTMVNKQDILVRGAIGLAIQKDEGISYLVSQLSEAEASYKEIKALNKKINSEIEVLKNEHSDFSEFQKLVNLVLENNEINLKLNLANNGENGSYYWIGHSLTNERLSIGDISEGEKNLLALLFFFYELYEDEQQENLKPDLELIVLDDPISSLDDSNRFFVIELVKKLLKEKSSQIFVLTHVWNDFCQLVYGLPRTNDKLKTVEYYEVYKDINAKSNLRIVNSAVKPYKKLFKEVYQLSQKNYSDELTDCDVYHSCNSMRRVFEEFLQFKTGNSILPQKSHQNDIARLICNSLNQEKISGTQNTRLGRFLEVINVLSHTNQRNYKEIIDSARFMMNLINQMDRGHYLSMIN